MNWHYAAMTAGGFAWAMLSSFGVFCLFAAWLDRKQRVTAQRVMVFISIVSLLAGTVAGLGVRVTLGG